MHCRTVFIPPGRRFTSVPAPAAQVEDVGQEMEPAGSVVELVHQANWLNDDDYVSAGGSGLTFTPIDGTARHFLHC